MNTILNTARLAQLPFITEGDQPRRPAAASAKRRLPETTEPGPAAQDHVLSSREGWRPSTAASTL